MIAHTFTPREYEMLTINPDNRTAWVAHLNPIIGELTVSIDYRVTTFSHVFASMDYKVTTNEEELKQVKSLLRTKHDDYLINDPYTKNKVLLEVVFDEDANIGIDAPIVTSFDIGSLRSVVVESYTYTVTGKVYGYKIPVEENDIVKL